MQGARFWLGVAIAGGLTAALSTGSPAVAGPTLNVITRFDYDPGAQPRAGVTVIGNRLYGVTTDGGVLEENPLQGGWLG